MDSGSHPWLDIRITWRALKNMLSPTPNQLNHLWWWPHGCQGWEPLLDQRFSLWQSVRVVIAVGYAHYRMANENGLADLQRAENLKPAN